MGPPLLPQAQAWPQTWSVSWLARATLRETGGHTAHLSGWERGKETAPVRALDPACPFPYQLQGPPCPTSHWGAHLRPKGHKITEHPSCKNLGDQRLSLLIQLLGKQKPGKRCGLPKDTEHPGCAVWLPAQGLSQNPGAPTHSPSRCAHGLSLPQLKYLI